MKEHELRIRIYECKKNGHDGYQYELEGQGVNANMMFAAVNELLRVLVEKFIEEGEDE